MTLFIDDEKKPEWFKLDVTQIAWAKTFDDGLRLALLNKPDVIYLDHDLGDKRKDGSILLNLLISKGVKPELVYIISWNPVGVQRIKYVCNDHKIRYKLWDYKIL